MSEDLTLAQLRRLERRLNRQLARTRKKIEAETKARAEAAEARRRREAERAAKARERAREREVARARREQEKAQRKQERERARADAKAQREREAKAAAEAKRRANRETIERFAGIVAEAASEHYGVKIKAHAILDRGGNGRVFAARAVLIWLARERASMTYGAIADCLDRRFAAIWQRYNRPLTIAEANILHRALKRLAKAEAANDARNDPTLRVVGRA